MPIGWGWLCRWSTNRYLAIRLLQYLVCTLVFAWQSFEETPLAVAANREEANGRPSEPPALYRHTPRVIAPRDTRVGGTWIGYNDAGVFVGITNRWVDREGNRSRGKLVADCLECTSATAALEYVEQTLQTHRYAGFNLVVTDRNRAMLLEFDGELTVSEFAPGIHVVVNVGHNGAYFEPPNRPEAGRTQATNAERLQSVLQPKTGETAEEWLFRAGKTLGDHDYGVCSR